MQDFNKLGWAIFEPEAEAEAWAKHALEAAREALADPALDHWYQCERTWYVGLDVLPNDAAGQLPGGPPFSSKLQSQILALTGSWTALHRAQLSGVFAGYPRPRAGESDAAFRYRQKRDAAHVDGVIGKGEPKKRYVLEPHAFILGLPLTEASPGAGPLVVWEGSHLLMQKAFSLAFRNHDGAAEKLDVTALYQETRRTAFDTFTRRPLVVAPGGAILLHRLLLHGVAPFQPDAWAAPDGRLIAYFRPPMPGGARAWADLG